jgi:outer membrane protein OmpA-like peptidoglycan-associated protein
MNRRLAVPIILLLLALFGGAVWALYGPLHLATSVLKPSEEKPQAAAIREEVNPAAKPETSRSATPPKPNKDAVFDVARIDPNGTSVFAGHTDPGSQVTIKADGKEIGTATADENGEWTFITEQKFASADPTLGVSIKPASESGKQAAATAPGKSEPAKAETKRAEAAPEAAKPHTAREVTAGLLNDLKGMVDAARSGKPEPVPAPAAAPPASPPATVPQTSAPQQGQPEKTQTAQAPPGGAGAVKLSVENGEPVRKSIPVPVTFVFNEATFTDDGQKAAALLLEYLKLKSFKKVMLTGHADERGSDELNMELSRERLQTVADFLKAGGYSGELDLVPKGKREPYLGVVRSDYNQEELWQLDRRVELIITPDQNHAVQ